MLVGTNCCSCWSCGWPIMRAAWFMPTTFWKQQTWSAVTEKPRDALCYLIILLKQRQPAPGPKSSHKKVKVWVPEADLGMFSMFGRTGAPQKWGLHMRTNKLCNVPTPKLPASHWSSGPNPPPPPLPFPFNVSSPPLPFPSLLIELRPLNRARWSVERSSRVWGGVPAESEFGAF